MIKIGVYCKDSNHKKEIKMSLKQYFNDLNIESEICNIRTKMSALYNLAVAYTEFNIVLLCEDNKITYVKRNLVNYMENYSSQTVGWTDIPLDNDKIDKIIINEDYHNCPHGVYGMNTRKTVRAISYSDIEYCQWMNGKTVIFLKDNETEEINESIKILKTKLPEIYFADCIKGYIINMYNVKRIDRVNKRLIMKSGNEINVSRYKFTDIIRLYIRVMFGI